MYKIIGIIIACISIQGCYQSANQTDIRKAIKYCEDVNNIEYIEISMNGEEVVKCLNKDAIILGRVKL